MWYAIQESNQLGRDFMLTAITPDREVFLRRDEFDDNAYFLEIRRITGDGYYVVAYMHRDCLIDALGEALANAVAPGERLPITITIATVL